MVVRSNLLPDSESAAFHGSRSWAPRSRSATVASMRTGDAVARMSGTGGGFGHLRLARGAPPAAAPHLVGDDQAVAHLDPVRLVAHVRLAVRLPGEHELDHCAAGYRGPTQFLEVARVSEPAAQLRLDGRSAAHGEPPVGDRGVKDRVGGKRTRLADACVLNALNEAVDRVGHLLWLLYLAKGTRNGVTAVRMKPAVCRPIAATGHGPESVNVTTRPSHPQRVSCVES